MDSDILAQQRKCFLLPHPCHSRPHPHTKARSSKAIRSIFLEVSDIVPNNITVTNLNFFKLCSLVIHPLIALGHYAIFRATFAAIALTPSL